jgi:hypothetical protein
MVLQERECDEQCIDPLDFEIQWHELERNNMGFIIVQKICIKELHELNMS